MQVSSSASNQRATGGVQGATQRQFRFPMLSDAPSTRLPRHAKQLPTLLSAGPVLARVEIVRLLQKL